MIPADHQIADVQSGIGVQLTPEPQTFPGLLWQRRAIVASTIGAIVLVCALGYVHRNYQLDDALIYHRYFQNALDGNGLVYNVGERFNGLTSPLYTYLSLLMSLVVGDVQTAQLAISVVGLCGIIVGLQFLLRYDVSWLTLVVLPLLVASHTYFYWLFGLETLILLSGMLLALVFYRSGSYRELAVVLALLILTRGEMVFLLVAFFIEHLRLRRSFPSWRVFVVPAALLLAAYGFNWLYYGSPLPDTMSAKIYQGQSGLWGRYVPFMRVYAHPEHYFDSNPFLIGCYLILALVGAVRSLHTQIGRVLVLFLVFYWAFFLGLRIPSYFWYHAPSYLIWIIYAALGFDAVVGFAMRRNLRLKRTLGVTAATVTVVAVATVHGMYTVRFVASSGPPGQYRAIGEWMDENLEADASVGLAEIGAVGWYSRRRIVDLCGLVSPHNARFLGHNDYDSWIVTYRPDYILLHRDLWTIETGAARAALDGRYTDDPRFPFSGFRLLRTNVHDQSR
jgi:hypothetical protein